MAQKNIKSHLIEVRAELLLSRGYHATGLQDLLCADELPSETKALPHARSS
jgi:hypothetical protein